MANNGFIKLPYSLIESTTWQEARSKHKIIFITVLSLVVNKETPFSANGNPITLLPGQFAIPIRRLAKLCGPDISKNDVVGFIKYFTAHQFLRQEVRHDLSILTIIHQATYDQIIYTSQTKCQTKVRQKSDTKVNIKNISSSKDSDILVAHAQPTTEQEKILIFNQAVPEKYRTKLSQSQFDELQKQFPALKISELAEQMADWCSANNHVYKDWSAAMRNWCRKQRVTPDKKEKKSTGANFDGAGDYPRNRNVRTYSE